MEIKKLAGKLRSKGPILGGVSKKEDFPLGPGFFGFFQKRLVFLVNFFKPLVKISALRCFLAEDLVRGFYPGENLNTFIDIRGFSLEEEGKEADEPANWVVVNSFFKGGVGRKEIGIFLGEFRVEVRKVVVAQATEHGKPEVSGVLADLISEAAGREISMGLGKAGVEVANMLPFKRGMMIKPEDRAGDSIDKILLNDGHVEKEELVRMVFFNFPKESNSYFGEGFDNDAMALAVELVKKKKRAKAVRVIIKEENRIFGSG